MSKEVKAEIKIPENRVRMSMKQTSKGLVQMDITAESDTPKESGKLLNEAIKTMKKTLKDNNLQTVDEKVI